MRVYISIPRFALSGGNLVTLEVAKYLAAEGVEVYCCSGFKLKRAEDVTLSKPRRGLFNTFLNLVSFAHLSLLGLFVKNYVATHHLTSLFNFIRKARFALVQDIECDFYPRKLKRIGNLLWKNYLSSQYLIVTNPYLAEKINSQNHVEGFSFIPVDKSIEAESNAKRVYDVVAVIRDGEYKAPQRTLRVLEELAERGYNVVAINGTRRDYKQQFVIGNLNRKDFMSILSTTKVFLCLSKWEGLGLPNFEAYVCGCDIISTPIPSGCLLANIDAESIDIIEDASSPEEISDITCTRLTTKDAQLYNDDAEFLLQRKETLMKKNSIWLNYAKAIIQGSAK
ncbi:glycosyltransferase [Kosakonia cowanii]|uniref:glycosyltransferase n=1 Tax=Kosakonia cowanii TaxID=208223 RepID=UPI0040630EF9